MMKSWDILRQQNAWIIFSIGVFAWEMIRLSDCSPGTLWQSSYSYNQSKGGPEHQAPRRIFRRIIGRYVTSWDGYRHIEGLVHSNMAIKMPTDPFQSGKIIIITYKCCAPRLFYFVINMCNACNGWWYVVAWNWKSRIVHAMLNMATGRAFSKDTVKMRNVSIKSDTRNW